MKKILLICFTLPLLFSAGNAMADLNDGLVAYYPFNGNANDESGNSNDGTVNLPVLIEDRFGNDENAYYFDGDDYIEVSDKEDFHLQTFSISVWIKPQQSETHSVIIAHDGNGQGINLFIWHPNIPCVSIGDGEWTDLKYLDGIKMNQWYHLVTTFDGVNLQLFVNNNLVNQLEYTKTITYDDRPIQIGRNGWSLNITYFKGVIDDLRIYNRAITVDEIQQVNSENKCSVQYQSGYEDGKQACVNDPTACGITSGLYTEEDMLNMVNRLLRWDSNKDNQIGLVEAVKILRDTAGVIKSSQD